MVARKNSPLTGRNLEQDQAHVGDPHEGEGGGQIEKRIDTHHANTLVTLSNQN